MSLRVLVIEDNAMNLALMTYVLQAFGHEVIAAFRLPMAGLIAATQMHGDMHVLRCAVHNGIKRIRIDFDQLAPLRYLAPHEVRARLRHAQKFEARGAPERLADARHAPALAYLEAHIEQGPVLEAEGLAVGAVTAINGFSRLRANVTGLAGHAGTVPMDARRDALAAAAEMVLATERVARAQPELVATVGTIGTGEWAATNIAVAHGGTGSSSASGAW